MSSLRCPKCGYMRWEFVFSGETTVWYVLGANGPSDPERSDKISLNNIICLICDYKVPLLSELWLDLSDRLEGVR